MKKVLPILLVAAMALPVWADVAVTADGTTVTITPSGDAAIRGVALNFKTTDGDAALDSVSDVTVTGLNTNIDYFYSNGIGTVAGETPDGEGHAVADPAAAGVLTTLPASEFSVSSGYLDAAGTQLGQTGAITIAVTFSGSGEVTVTADMLRGGIVGDELGTITGLPLVLTVGGTEPTCRDLLTPAQQADYDAYVAAGKDPSCWCWRYNCYGDIDNATETALKYRIYNADIAELVANWKAKIATANPCADLDRAYETALKYRVYNADIALLVSNWKKKDSALVPDCPTYLAP